MSSPLLLASPVPGRARLRTPRTPRTLRTPRTPRSRLRRLAAALAATIAVMTSLVVSAGPAQADVPPRTALEASIAWSVKNLIVTERAVSGVGYIGMSKYLQLSARRHDLAMARANTMSHQLSGEYSFGTRITQTGYIWNWAGENIAWNSDMTTAGALGVQRMMFNERAPDNGHRLNILNPHFSNVGVDVYLDTVHHKLWMTVDFGHRR